VIERLSVSKPHRVLYIAGAQGIEERRTFLTAPWRRMDYVGAIVADISHVTSGRSIDRKYVLGLIWDPAGDVAGSVANASDDLAAGNV
jgi:hypothetical protein